jgi:glycosyltransferase involved in cell wall biosynthesis
MGSFKLSVIVATWNRLPELQAMLDSLLPQILDKPVQLVIVDDCSTDTTWEWLQREFAGSGSTRFFRTDTNSGPGPARNLALAAALGTHFVPIDSDFILLDGSINVILQAIEADSAYPLIFFPCLQYPAMRRLGGFAGRKEVSYEEFVAGRVGEMLPVTSLSYLREHGLKYPDLRAGGESLLWWRILVERPALFLDRPLILYRTDVTERICTLAYQLKHPRDLAAIADAMVLLLSDDDSRAITSVRIQKTLAAGTYHLLAGDICTGRRRLASAAGGGNLTAFATLAASFFGYRVFRALFSFYRTKVRPSYL